MSGEGPLAPGLYLVSTPIGSARDITLRALDVLRDADVLAAEDTRTLRRLMEIHGVPLNGRRVVAYHDHNGARARPGLIAAVREGRSVAYASEAGTPLIADPGFDLAREAARAGLPVTAAPGPAAVIVALTLSGLPTDCFAFLGFLPTTQGARRRALEGVADFPGTLVIYESPKRCSAIIHEIGLVLGEEREVAVCRELTKRFEEVIRGSVAEVAEILEERPARGEVVICIARGERKLDPADVDAALIEALDKMRVKDAAKAVSDQYDLPRRDVYQRALELKEGKT